MTSQTNALKGTHILAKDIDWEAAYKEYLPRVYNFFRYRVNDRALAEDLTSATFEKAWRGRSRFRQDLSAFSTWLFTIARNVATDHFRRRRNEISLESAREPADSVSLEEIVQRNHDTEVLHARISQLPVRERELIAFKYGAGLNNREIARLTRLSESNVGIILFRVVQKLRDEMEVSNER
ncbi:MAG TPA: sigma-70 family RNA polymerase sigma factor [Anaerolineales bacterium]|nr:sigma-70 family RNA polymerase sigma factor [Anaerolineales bacterium]